VYHLVGRTAYVSFTSDKSVWMEQREQCTLAPAPITGTSATIHALQSTHDDFGLNRPLAVETMDAVLG
jgi:hypothetical protein